MCVKNKLSNIIIWSLIVFLFIVCCLLICFRNKNTINYKYKDKIDFELTECIKVCAKNNDSYIMYDYYVEKENIYLNVISLYLGSKKYLNTDTYIPSNMVIDIIDAKAIGDSLFINANNYSPGIFTEGFKMMKITFKELNIKNIYINNKLL